MPGYSLGRGTPHGSPEEACYDRSSSRLVELRSWHACTMTNDDRRLKILYALGPGDVVQMWRDTKAGIEPPFEMSVAFSKLFVDWCDTVRADAHLLSWHARRDLLRDERYTLENRPKPTWYWRRGLRHHLGNAGYGLSVVMAALRERPLVVVVDSGTTEWIVLAALSLARIPVIAVMHSTLWPTGFPPKRLRRRLLHALDGLFFRRIASATVCVSPECERQVRAVARRPRGPILQCRAQFSRKFFEGVTPPPPHALRPFRVLFVGRIEESKGVFDILTMAERLASESPGQFAWKICGTGSASDALAASVRSRGLGDVVDVTGRLTRDQMLAAYGWSHATIVPTRGDYREGLAMTAAEAVLAARPVVLSAVVPAWEVLGDAAVRVATHDVDGFVSAIRKLAHDHTHYERCRQAAHDMQGQFYDVSQGLGAVLGRAITSLLEWRTPSDSPTQSPAEPAR